MGSRVTKCDLDNVTDYIQFEFFCNNLMSAEGYKGIEPMGGHKDRGRDAIDVDKSSGEVTIFTYSVREDWNDKLDEDLEKIKSTDIVVTKLSFLRPAAQQLLRKIRRKRKSKRSTDGILSFMT